MAIFQLDVITSHCARPTEAGSISSDGECERILLMPHTSHHFFSLGLCYRYQASGLVGD